MDKFEYKGKAEIKHLNVRKEGPEEDKVLAIDIKLQCQTGAEMIDFFHEGMTAALFTDVGAVKNSMLKPLAFQNTIMNMDLEIAGQKYYGVDVSKFVLEPKDGRKAEMTFGVSVKPSGDEVARLSEFVMDELDIHIQPQPELDFSGAQEAADNLNKLLAEDGATATLSLAGKVIAKFGGAPA